MLEVGSGRATSSDSVCKRGRDRVPQKAWDSAVFSAGKVGWRACVQTLALLLGGPGGPRYTPCLLPAQQQDDLGAAFQTWMDTNGALRAEVLPRALSGGNGKNGSCVVNALHMACTERFIARGASHSCR